MWRDSYMQVMENWQPKGITVYMDDKRFVNCVLTECRLVYGGGDVTWENTQFVNCQLTFDGAAQRTVAYCRTSDSCVRRRTAVRRPSRQIKVQLRSTRRDFEYHATTERAAVLRRAVDVSRAVRITPSSGMLRQSH